MLIYVALELALLNSDGDQNADFLNINIPLICFDCYTYRNTDVQKKELVDDRTVYLSLLVKTLVINVFLYLNTSLWTCNQTLY